MHPGSDCLVPSDAFVLPITSRKVIRFWPNSCKGGFLMKPAVSMIKYFERGC